MTLQYGGMFEQGNMRYLLSSGNVEDNFNTWIFQWHKVLRYDQSGVFISADLPGGLHATDEIHHFIDDKNDTIHIMWHDDGSANRYGVFSCADFSTLLLTSGTASEYDPQSVPYGQNYGVSFGMIGNIDGGISRSMQTYVAFSTCGTPSYNCEIVDVIRNYTRLWHHSVWDDLPSPQNTKAEIKTVEISTTGKYIIVTTECYVSPHYYYDMLLYKGSYVET